MTGLLEYLPEEWAEEAQCRGMDHKIFFPDERGAAVRRVRRIAKSICMQCVVRAECLEYALTTNQTEGIWGGLDEKERKKYQRRLRRS